MNKYTIFIDSDDTLADTNIELLRRANEMYGTNYTKDDIYEWDLEKVFPDINVQQFFDQEGFFYSLKPLEGSVEYTKKLIDEGYELIVLTASTINGFKDKALWLQKYYPHIPIKNLILGWRKEFVKGDIMLDDGLHNIRESICMTPVIFNQPWNEEAKENFLRVSNWEEFYNLVHKLYPLDRVED